MSEIRVDKIKGRQVGASGPDITIAADGDLALGNADVTGINQATIATGEFTSALNLPTYTNGTRPSSPATGTLIFNTEETQMQVYNGEEWVGAGSSGAVEVTSTGSVTTSGQYTIHTFTGDGSFIVSSGGPLAIDTLLVGGGGGGGTRNAGPNSGGTDGGSGGGAGGWVQVSGMQLQDGTYAVTVGGGGQGFNNNNNQQPGTPGSNSTFNSLVAYGGGYGASGPGNRPGGPGGSGGGAGGGGGSPGSGGSATQPGAPGQSGANGYGNGGGPNPNQAPYTGSGGGGAGSGGAQGGNSRQAPGGNGRASSITGQAVTYAGGGGGGGGFPSPTRGGNGGPGGGGNGGSSPSNSGNGAGQAGTPGRGGGGGGGAGSSWPSGAAGQGGSGIVIVRYVTP